MRKVRRSGLIMPVNIRRFVERAWTRGSDSITLDLEDAVAPAEKPNARAMMREAIPLSARGGSDISVRINHETPREDCEGSVWSGLSSVSYPKTESAEEIRELDRIISRLERERGIPPGSVEINAMIETAQGVWSAYAIASASPRIRSLGGVADGDLTADLGVPIEYLWEVDALAYGRGECDLVARALGLAVSGRVWTAGRSTIADYGDPEKLYQANRRSYEAGYRGGGGIHPAQVEACNRAFTPTPEEVEEAREVVGAYEEAFARGEAFAEYKGRLVDRRVADAARDFEEFAEACASKDAEKAERAAQLRAQEKKA
ncbi:MAG: hypothetical protein HY686_09065 [Chloroflexi bacterium]|nr:hypothetical protein [Chloroflexota bacterium]